MAFFSEINYLAPKGTTGNVLGSAVQGIPDYYAAGFQFVVEAAGATPTITFTVQGSLDNITWSDITYLPAGSDTASVAPQTVTAVGTTVFFLDDPSGARFYKYWRLNPTANTNITFRCEMTFRTIN